MKKYLFIGNFNFDNKTLIIKDKEFTNQVKNVLRFKIGDTIFLGNGQNTEARTEILEIKKDEVVVKIISIEANKNEYTKDVTLYLAILKRENFELVIQKATEIGIKQIVPVISERTIKTGLKTERLEKIIKEASEQSGRGILPTITEPMKFKDALAHAQANQVNLFFHLDGEALNKIKLTENKIGLFVGPEGGWSASEVAEIKKSDTFKKVSLGKLTLRGETAAIVACYLGLQ
ncbi:16S rRNA (uracil(1498)-N(3))-methyltransferase [Candidatus Parcubacteria bacterium]|nr:16S rRNA (uracil(1498)-N(3))-methyltransferase [Patescibacteria group bacterium]MBU4309881.1 16S rRNA (uracil(1498)-N(3))-methyltransferase [Patescibacteria group bacterium]MBU4431889.1 16S rRNA (uracil(1498)-N(3))-methyltransferase [Patescibacteria group bacterium]MBU4578220.1 16S rRNA (uracil(1498)-N(3))-methyltransferase [Patescibacteria group bacterium]MCG2696756.1 16S rRNA (uracil(1498)-N(3))-methyltransferase [Candidatus Parcubacteria bacterium]